MSSPAYNAVFEKLRLDRLRAEARAAAPQKQPPPEGGSRRQEARTTHSAAPAAPQHAQPAKRKRDDSGAPRRAGDAAPHGAARLPKAERPARKEGEGSSAARVRMQKLHSGVPLGKSAPHAAVAQQPAAAPAKQASAAATALTKRQKLMASVHLPAHDPVTPAAKSALSFDADWHDHCETPFEAYRDIEPLLFQLALRLGKTKATLRIYDPFYCEGSMVAHLGRLGFESVYNANEDCYAVWAAGREPEYDVLVTNPPYSGDHIHRCVDYAARCGRPYLLLLPSFCCRKSSYRAIFAAAGVAPPAYLAPARRYVYFAPGRKVEATAATSPFDSLWYMCLTGAAGEPAEPLLSWWERKYAKATGCTLARTVEQLPAELTPVRDEKRANPKARRRAAKRAGILHQQFGIAHAHIRRK